MPACRRALHGANGCSRPREFAVDPDGEAVESVCHPVCLDLRLALLASLQSRPVAQTPLSPGIDHVIQKNAARLARLCLGATLLAASFSLPQSAALAAPSCWSLLQSKYGPGILKAVDEADPCAKMPGFDKKERFDLTGLELCTAADGVQVNAQADLACKSSSHGGLLKGMAMSGKLQASMTVDIGACQVTDVHVGVSGPVGELLSSVGDIQGLAKRFAQKKVSEVCGAK